MNVKPIYKHDCTRCTYLGTYVGESAGVDLYCCLQSIKVPTLVARFSSERSDYVSGIRPVEFLSDAKNPLAIAYFLSLGAGLQLERP